MPILSNCTLKVGAQAVAAAYFRGVNVAGASFSAQSVAFEGDNYVTRAALAGVTDSRQGSVSMFFQIPTDGTVFREVFAPSGTRIRIQLDDSKRLRVNVSNGVISFIFRSVAQITPADGEVHAAIAWDTNAASGGKTGVIVINGTPSVEVVSDTGAAFTPTCTSSPAIGATSAGANPLPMTAREVLYWPGVFIDWTNPANLVKVYASGAPVNPGVSGELVTGTAPAVYLSLRGNAAAGTFLTNRGTGGDFAQAAGTPTIRADTPFIPYGDSLVFGTGSTIYPTDTWVFKVARGLNTKRRRYNYGVGGESITAITSRFVAAIGGHVAAFPKSVYVLEGGYNSIANGSAHIISKAQEMITAMTTAQPAGKWIYIGIPNGQHVDEGIGGTRYATIIAANEGIAAIAGERFLDMRAWLIENGLAAAGLTATANDLADIASGRVPRQLQSDGLHYNNFGQIAWGVAVRQKLQALGYD